MTTTYTWKDWPATGSVGFESNARDAISTNKSNCVGLDEEITGARGAYDSLEDKIGAIAIGDYQDLGKYGFIDKSLSTLTWTNSTPDRTLSIQPTSTNFSYYINGVKYTSTGDTVQIDDTEGIHVIYYDDDTLTALANPTLAQISTIIQTTAIACIVYWDTSEQTAIYVGEERHGITMAPATHAYLHFFEGLRYLSGLGLNTMSVDGSGATADAQFGIDAGAVADEDIYHSISAVTSTTGFPIYYMLGSSADWQKYTNTGFGVRTQDGTTSTRLAYNDYNSGDWQLSEVSNNDYVLYHIFATTEKDTPMISIMGQNIYTKKSTARAGALAEVHELILNNILFPEIRAIATVIFQTSLTYANDVNAIVISTDEGDNYIDWRNEVFSRTAISTSDHAALSNRSATESHPASAINTDTTNFDGILSSADTDLQTALETIDEYVGGTVDLSGTPEANDIARFTDSDTLEGLSYAELLSALGITTGAEPNAVDSVNGSTGVVVIDADDIDDTSTTNKFTTATDISKLAGIAESADVTDATNVAAAGALMDSDLLDQDDFSSNSATQPASQQSIKSYVDTGLSGKSDTTHDHSGTYLAAATKLDDLSTPDDNTDLNASTSAHGLLPKLSGSTDAFLRADGSWQEPVSGMNWSVISANTTATRNNGYLIDASSSNITLTLPILPSEGDMVGACDYKNQATTNTITIARNGSNIEGNADDMVINVNGAGVTLVYADATRGWEIVSEASSGSYLQDLADDLTPVLGGDLDLDGHTIDGITATEIGYLDGVTSNIQTQIGTKLTAASNLSDVATAATAFANIKQAATDEVTGVVEIATDAETVTGTSDSVVTTPGNITARLAAPGEIGGTTPGIVNATRVDSSQVKAPDANGLLLTDDGDNGIFVKDGGNVGIGTSSPGANLDVKSSINLINPFNASMVGLKGSYYGYSGVYKVLQIGDTTGNYNVAIGYDPSANTGAAFSGNGYEILFRNGASFITPNSTDTNFHRDVLCLEDGNVGIGTTSPDAKLHVSGGNIKVDSTYGIDFSASADSSASGAAVTTGGEVLDDYEEGTWTPVLGGSTSESGQTYSTQDGTYTKVGRLVHVQFFITLTAKGTIAGDLTIKGLPFAASSGGYSSISFAVQRYFSLSTGHILTGYVGQSLALCYLQEIEFNNDNTTSLSTTAIADNTVLCGSINYHA